VIPTNIRLERHDLPGKGPTAVLVVVYETRIPLTPVQERELAIELARPLREIVRPPEPRRARR